MKLITIFAVLFYVNGASADSSHSEHQHHGHHEELKAQTHSYEGTIYSIQGEWESQDGKKFTLQDIGGKPHLFAMVYTRCQTACPILVEDVKKVVKALPPEHQNLEVILFSIDSETETVESLMSLYKEKKLKPSWTAARANSKDVATLAVALGVNYKRLPDGEYVHSNSIFFIDAAGNLVAQQDGLNKTDPRFIEKITSTLKPAKTPGFLNKTKQYFKNLFRGSSHDHD